MRVIGNKPEGEVEIVCKKCHWRLAYVPSDISHCERDWDEGDPAYDYITCPKCHVRIVLRTAGQLDSSDYDL